MSVKTLASWSAHALRTRPGILSGLATLRALTCFKVLLTSAMNSQITQSSKTTGHSRKTQCYIYRIEHETHLQWKKKYVNPLELPGFLNKLVIQFHLIFIEVTTIEKHSLLKRITQKQL
jgi:hypothetical protein